MVQNTHTLLHKGYSEPSISHRGIHLGNTLAYWALTQYNSFKEERKEDRFKLAIDYEYSIGLYTISA